MRKRPLNCSVHVLLAVLCLGAMINSTTAGSFTRGCAARDLQILMLIEERENTEAISPERLSDALVTMMNVRMICYEGHVVDDLRNRMGLLWAGDVADLTVVRNGKPVVIRATIAD